MLGLKLNHVSKRGPIWLLACSRVESKARKVRKLAAILSRPQCVKFSLYWPHDDVIKWKHFPRYWPFVQGIHRSPVNSPHKGQWRGALMFTLICARISGWVNNREAGDLRPNRAHYGVIVMWLPHIMKGINGFQKLGKNVINPPGPI